MPESATGWPPSPDRAVVVPTWLPAGHAGSVVVSSGIACGSWHCSTLEISAASPGGSSRSIFSIAWFPSGRPIVTVKGENAPACMFVEPPEKVVSNGSVSPGHGVPLGPEVIWNEEASDLLSLVSTLSFGPTFRALVSVAFDS